MIRTLVLCGVCALSSLAAPPFGKAAVEEERARQMELDVFRDQLESARDSLQYEVTQRYAFKQQTVEQREVDKAELETLREANDRALAELSRVKEEALVKEQVLAEERALARERVEQWQAVRGAMADVFQKDAGQLAGAFPTTLESRREALESVRTGLASDASVGPAWRSYVRYRGDWLASACSVSVFRQTILTADHGARALSLARFGDVFAYGADSSGRYYMVRQTGRLGADRFTVETVVASRLLDALGRLFPGWVREGVVRGSVIADVMQNEQTRLLVSGTRVSWWQDTVHQLRMGGAVMIPLLLLPLWALALAGWKTVQFVVRRRRMRPLVAAVSALVDKGDFGGALTYVKSRQGPAARLLEACLERRVLSRASAEHAARDILHHETHVLNHGLNTLAVIAGAAPLLGLLGTISGMITLFAAVTHYGTGDPKFLAGGISEALITAKTGLAIAIPVLFAHDFLRGRKERLLADTQQAATAMLNRLWPEG